jgi:transaldolase
MQQQQYLFWAISNTKTAWWHDSAEPGELKLGIERGAAGATTNPFLANLALSKNCKTWEKEIKEFLSKKLEPEKRAELLMNIPIRHAAEQLLPIYKKTGGRMGYLCAQVNPSSAGDRQIMLEMARRFHKLAPNIAVKLPATSAGLDVLEDCVAEGATVTATVSFTVPQVVAIAERHLKGIKRAKKNGIEPGKCFAIIMIGRLDDYLRQVAHDEQADISEDDIRQAGLAVTKRAYSIYKQRKYEAVLLITALRGTYHMTELAGADVIMSIAPPYQQMLLSKDLPREQRIDKQIDEDVLDRLCMLREFVRSYEIDGMSPREFISFGITQRTLAQFAEAGWNLLQKFELPKVKGD